MKTLSIVSLLAGLAVAAVPASAQTDTKSAAKAPARAAAGFTLSSPDLKGGTFANAQLFNGFGCTGGNTSPHIVWKGAPAGTKSFVLMVHDPDAPTGSGWWHWVVANIPGTATEIPAGASKSAKMPAGSIETRNDMGQPGYMGPCPPPGPAHRYVFTLYALKLDKIDVTADASGAYVGFNAKGNALASATFTAKYGR
jgi:Raf kinase inhibitor-like YbhB/YbcL family protein